MRLFSKSRTLFCAITQVYILAIAIGACKSLDNNDVGRYWQDSKITTKVDRLPNEYRGLTLDFERLKNDIEKSNMVAIPLADGNNIIVRIERSKTMSKELAKKFPDIISYQIVKTDEVSGRIDVNPSGFYAMIVTIGNTYFINPITKKESEYISYDKHNMMNDPINPLVEKYFKP